MSKAQTRIRFDKDQLEKAFIGATLFGHQYEVSDIQVSTSEDKITTITCSMRLHYPVQWISLNQ